MFVWSVHVCCLHLKMEFCSCARGGASVVWHSLPLMNSFNKTEAAVCLVQAMLPEGFPFYQFIIHINWEKCNRTNKASVALKMRGSVSRLKGNAIYYHMMQVLRHSYESHVIKILQRLIIKCLHLLYET